MPSARLTLREEDVVRLALEFLHNRELHITQLSLERETGVINGGYSDDVLFLRQLILDGQWDDVLEFIQPLEALNTFEMRKFSYTILKHKYIELLCIKSEANMQGSSVDNAVEEVVKVLNELEKYAPSKEEHSHMCLLLTLPRLTDHMNYKDWNPSNARVQCFREVYPYVAEFLPGDRKPTDANANMSAKNDRLIQLIIKGILYESCVNYCQAKATGTKDPQTQDMNFAKLLDGSVGFSDSDLSLLSWLQSIPPDTFAVPFEQRTLNVDVERLERPSLETSWTEHMLVTPIKPKTFPHSAMPFTRPRSAADAMTRSLMPALDGLPSGLSHNSSNGNPRAMALSTGDISANPMTRSSFASFHLTGIKNAKAMNSSVDRLFENEGEVFLSNSYAEFQQLPSIQEQTSTPNSKLPQAQAQTARTRSKSPESKMPPPSTPEHRGRESPGSIGTSRSSRRDSLNERPSNPAHNIVLTPPVPPTIPTESTIMLEQSFNGDLLKEFQKQKQKVMETIAMREKEREELLKQIHMTTEPNDIKQQSANKMNGMNMQNRNLASSPRPNINGNDNYRTPSRQDGPSDGLYDAIKAFEFDEDGQSEDSAEAETMGTAINHAAAIKRLEALFGDVKLEGKQPLTEVVEVESSVDAKCDVHGLHGKNAPRRGSLGNILHANNNNRRDSLSYIKQRDFSTMKPHVHNFGGGVGPRRESMPALNAQNSYYRRRGSLGLPNTPPKKEIEHPSHFAAMLRRDPLASSMGSLRKDGTLNGPWSNSRRESLPTNSLRKDLLQVPTRRISNRRFSNDSLDGRRNSWDPGRRGSSGSSIGWEDPIWEDKPVPRSAAELDNSDSSNSARPKFVAVTALEDVQAVRCAEFHPSGQLYAVGSNSKTLRICSYPKLNDLREDHQTYQPTVLFKRTKHHKGSIYCLAWSPVGDLMATGSNDKTVKLMRFNADTSNLEGEEVELSMHDGTIRDLCFLEDTSNKSSLLISGGAGDCKIYVTDCATGTPFQALSGHTGHILTLNTWGGAMFVSGSHDKTVRFWDLRTRGCVNLVTPVTVPGTRQGSPVAAICVDPSGRLLVSGHEDSSCVLYDIRGGRNIQCFKPHSADVRSIRFSPSAYYLLSGGYDNKLVLTDLQGDLTLPLPSVVVAQHQDKVISGRWHPSEFSFLSTSADKTATLWALPPI